MRDGRLRPFDMTAEARFLLSFRPDEGDPPTGEAHEHPWEALRTAATMHRLEGLLIAAAVADSVPLASERSAELAGIEIRLTRERMWREQQLIEIASLLEEEGIELLVLKGMALAAIDYPDPQWRSTADLDLLVRTADVDRAERLLVSAGGRRLMPDQVPQYAALVGKNPTIEMEDGLEVDLHRILRWGPFGMTTPERSLWEGVRTVPIGERDFGTLGREETLLHCALNLLVVRSGGPARLVYARDIGELVTAEGFDVERSLVLARRWGVSAVLREAVLVAERLLGWDFPAELLHWAAGFRPTAADRVALSLNWPNSRLHRLEPLASFVRTDSAEVRAALRARMWQELQRR